MHKVDLDPAFGERTWAQLESALGEIFQQRESGLSYEELYRGAYNMVLHKHGDRLYSGFQALAERHLEGVAERVAAGHGEMLLEGAHREWREFSRAMQLNRDILMYMDRVYVRRAGRPSVEALGCQLWLSEVLRSPELDSRLSSEALRMVEREREGECVDQDRLRRLTQMLVETGGGAYAAELEEPLLEASRRRFRGQAGRALEAGSPDEGKLPVPEYLRLVEGKLEEEQRRVEAYLDPQTGPKLVTAVEDEMLAAWQEALLGHANGGFAAMLEQGDTDSMRLLHRLLGRVPGGVEGLCARFKEGLEQRGTSLVQEPESTLGAVAYVEGLLALKAKFDGVVAEAFDGGKIFSTAIQKGFETFMNLESTSAERLSQFLDDKLRSGFKDVAEDEIEHLIDRVMLLFRHLQDKDVFESYFKQHLAQRLLGGRPVSEDLERGIIARLKTECGHQFTSNVEAMFKDISTSGDIMARFRTSMEDQKDRAAPQGETSGRVKFDLNVQVLTSGSWPIRGAAATCKPWTLDPALRHMTSAFESFYLEAHSSRKLLWQASMGTAEIRAHFGGRKYDLLVSTHQLCVMLLFKDSSQLSFSEIRRATGMETADLSRALRGLACIKGKAVLLKEPSGKAVGEGDSFTYNEDFQSRAFRVKLAPTSQLSENGLERTEVRKRISEDRKPQVEAAIVRIMKARRTLHHNAVIEEVTRQLAPKFLPPPQMIKARLESLIEREFLELDGDNMKLYHYVC